MKSTFKILDMHCTACAINIDGELEDAKGVIASNTNYARSQTEVEYDPSIITPAKIIGLIKKAGYSSKMA